LAFTTVRGAAGVDFFGTPEIDNLVAFNEPQNVPGGTVYIGAREGEDIIEIQELTTGVASNFFVYGGQDADGIAVESALTDSIISGDDGDDQIEVLGLAAQSLITGGLGSDWIYTDSLTNTTVQGLDDNDIIEFGDGGYYDGDNGVTLSNSLVNGNMGEDIIYLDGVDRVIASKVLGGDQNDSILYEFSPSLIDFVNGTINGNKGNDFIEAYSSRDGGLTIFGGQGGDTIITGEENQPINGDEGGEIGGPDSAATYISGDLGNDSMVGGSEDDTILGGDGNDTGYGGFGNDYMEGNAGNDSMIGGRGDDTIYGGAGDDTLSGKGGVDLLVGRAGADTYEGNDADADRNFEDDTFIIEAISDSAAAVSGTERTFDKFIGRGFGTGGGESQSYLDISAVSDILAAGTLLNDNVSAGTGAGQVGGFGQGIQGYDLGEVADFRALQVAIDALNGGTGVEASSVNGIVINYFKASIGDADEAFYLQVSDSNRFYTSADLFFEMDMNRLITADEIIV
jgi:hypothetical protein